MAEVKGSSDFLGINHYTTSLVYPTKKRKWTYYSDYFSDSDTSEAQDPKWLGSASSWLKVAPFGIRKLMNWLGKNYGTHVPIYVTENGFSDSLGNLDDLHRIYYLKHYINQLLKGTITILAWSY